MGDVTTNLYAADNLAPSKTSSHGWKESCRLMQSPGLAEMFLNIHNRIWHVKAKQKNR